MSSGRSVTHVLGLDPIRRFGSGRGLLFESRGQVDFHGGQGLRDGATGFGFAGDFLERGGVYAGDHMNMNARLQVQAIQLGGQVNYIQAAESPAPVPTDEFEPAWEFWKHRLPVNGTQR